MQPSSWRQQSCIRVLKVQPGWEIILPMTWCLWLYGLFHSLACPKIKFKPSLLIQHLGVLARASGENTLKRRGSLPAPTRTGTNVGVSVDALTPAAHGPTMPGRTPQPAGDPQGAAPPLLSPPHPHKTGTSSWALSLLPALLTRRGETPLPAGSRAQNTFPLLNFWAYRPISTKSDWTYMLFENWWFSVKKRNPSRVFFLLFLWASGSIIGIGIGYLLIISNYACIFHSVLF